MGDAFIGTREEYHRKEGVLLLPLVQVCQAITPVAAAGVRPTCHPRPACLLPPHHHMALCFPFGPTLFTLVFKRNFGPFNQVGTRGRDGGERG